MLRRLERAVNPHRLVCFAKLNVERVVQRVDERTGTLHEWDRMVCSVCGRFYGYRPFWLRGVFAGKVFDSASKKSASVRRRRRGDRL